MNTTRAELKRSLAEQRAEIRTRCQKSFASGAGAEVDVFSDAVDLIAGALDQLSNPQQPVDELATTEVAAYSSGAYAYQLLLAIWDELRKGRAAAAEAMLRPAYEVPDYMLAFLHDESCVRDWKTWKDGVRIRRARDAAASFFDARRPGDGARWRKDRAATHQLMQNAPHVHPSNVKDVFVRSDGRWAMAPEGHYSEEIRLKAITAARIALDLASVFKIAFGPRLTMSWHAAADALAGDGGAALRVELGRMNT